MRHVLVFTLILGLGHASVAVAGETLLQSAMRVTQQLEERQEPPVGNAGVTKWARTGFALEAAQGEARLASSGLRKRTKILIAVAAAVGFAGTAYTIDRKNVDVTPSTLGTRTDR
jgi:hypothetical protein